MAPEALLEQVVDRESFLVFVDALIKERRRAEQMERDDPVRYQLGGALNWQNQSISTFLECACEYFERGRDHFAGDQLQWRDLAEFLYFGKIYE